MSEKGHMLDQDGFNPGVQGWSQMKNVPHPIETVKGTSLCGYLSSREDRWQDGFLGRPGPAAAALLRPKDTWRGWHPHRSWVTILEV